MGVLLLALLLLFTTAYTTALAVTGDTWDWGYGAWQGYYYPTGQFTATTKYDATVRKQPNGISEVLGTIYKGEKVTVYGREGNWYIVKWENSYGYVYTSYFEDAAQQPEPPVTPYPETVVYATEPVNVRSGPSSSYSKVGELQKGEAAVKLGTSGNWTMIRYFGQTAYVYSKYLTGSSAPVTPPSAETMYATTAVNVRKGPGTSYAKDGWLNKGDRVVKLGTSGSWTKIEWRGGAAYVYSKYLKADGSGAPAAGGKMYAKAETYIYSGPGTNYSKFAVLYAGQSITATGLVSGGWTQVIWNNGLAYVISGSLSSLPVYYPPTENIVTVTVRRAIVDTGAYKGPDSSSELVAIIRQGELVTCTGVKVGQWMQIVTANGYAFASANCLSDALYSYPSTAPSGVTKTVKADTLVYSYPSANSAYLIGILNKGSQVIKIADAGSGWVQIKFSNNSYGYVAGTALE
jgi:uncharacterized protein YgiM (DUF1202 family)